MATISNSAVALRFSAASFGSSKPLEFHPLKCGPTNVSFRRKGKVGMRKPLTIQATDRDYDGVHSAGIFVGGFIIGGLIIGALGCIYAPQISKTVIGEKRHLMKKLPKFMYNEEKDLQNTRKILMDKIIQLNGELDAVTYKLQNLEYL